MYTQYLRADGFPEMEPAQSPEMVAEDLEKVENIVDVITEKVPNGMIIDEDNAVVTLSATRRTCRLHCCLSMYTIV